MEKEFGLPYNVEELKLSIKSSIIISLLEEELICLQQTNFSYIKYKIIILQNNL